MVTVTQSSELRRLEWFRRQGIKVLCMAKRRRKRRLRRATPDAFDLFCYATTYWKAAASLGRELKVTFPFMVPVFVVEAFSLELHFKCLLRVRHKSLKQTHEPSDMWPKLSLRDQNLILRYASGAAPTIDIDSVLLRSKRMFKNLRYMHEGHDWPRDKTGAGGNGGLNDVVKAIRRIILEKHPDWQAKKNSRLGI